MRLVIATTIMWLVAGPAGAQHPAIDHEVERLVPQIIEIRHQIHAHPELGNREVATAALVADYLRAVGFDDVRTGVAHTGVVAVPSGVIVAHALTGGHVDDATTALDLIDKVEGDVSCLTADAAYDTRGIYEAAGARGATVVIPPTRTATVSGRRPRSPARDRTIRQVQQAGRRQWKKDSGYHQQARVENAFFRYKLIIGESLRARSRAGQETEAILACNILNQMTQRGRPASYAIGR